MDNRIIEILKRYKKMLGQLGITPERVIVFGSHARGRPDEYSDIDVVVISEDFAKLNLRERLEVLGIAAARIMEPVQALGYTAAEFEAQGEEKYRQFWPVKEIFRFGKVGITTGNDQLVTDVEKICLKNRIMTILSSKEDLLRARSDFSNQLGAKIIALRSNERFDDRKIVLYSYRPFDLRYICYSPNFIWRVVTECGRELDQPPLMMKLV